jgi:hypothetical protein
MKTFCTATIFGFLCFMSTAHASAEIRANDVTGRARAVKQGRVFFLEGTGDNRVLGELYLPGLVYVNGAKKVCPLGDIKLVEEILLDEGFVWTDERDAERTLVPAILLLYEGLSGKTLIDSRYYIARLSDGGPDSDAVGRLKLQCPAPEVTAAMGRWNIVLYQIRECIGECPVFKYTFSGTQVPFRIEALKVENLAFNPPIVLRVPPPR